MLGDGAQGPGERRHLPGPADRDQVTLGHVEGLRLLVLPDQVPVLPEAVVVRVLEVRDQDALFGGGDRGFQIAGPGPRAEALGDRFEPAYGAADREPSHPLAVPAAVGPGPLREGIERVGRPGCRLEVEAGHRPEVRDLVEVLDVLEEDGGDEGVRRVPAVLQHPERRAGHVRELGRHHPAVGSGHRLRPLVQQRVAGTGRLGERQRCGQQRGEREAAGKRVFHSILLPQFGGRPKRSRTSSSWPVISQRMSEIGIQPEARKSSWNSLRSNPSPSCSARSMRSSSIWSFPIW